MKTQHILAASLSLALAACTQIPAPPLQPASPAAAQQATAAPSRATAGEKTEKLRVKLRFGKPAPAGFAAKAASLGQLAFVRIEVVGEGFSGTLTHDGAAFLPVSGGTIEATVSEIPRDSGALRIVTLFGYDADQNLIDSFELGGYYVSSSDTEVEPVLSRQDMLLGRVLKQVLSDNPDLLDTLDISALETLLEEVTGYDPDAREVFQTDPAEFDPVLIVDLIEPDQPLPDAGTVEAAAVIDRQDVNLSVRTSDGGGFDEDVTLQLDDPESDPVVLLKASPNNSPVSFFNVPAGHWTLRAFSSQGEQLAQTTVTIDADGLTIGQDPFVLTGVASVFFQFQLEELTDKPQSEPSIALDDEGDFVAVWTSSYQDADNTIGVYGRRFTSSGEPAGGDFQIAQDINGKQMKPDVATDPDGDFVVAWESEGGQDGDHYGIFARRFSKTGVALDDEFPVNSFTTSRQRIPSVSVNDSGDFVIVWQSFEQDGSSYGVYGQRYAANGTPLGSEFPINQTTDLDQAEPQVALSDTGAFVVTWYDQSADGNSDGVFARHYDAAGTPLGNEFQVNQANTGSQTSPAVAIDADGDFVIAWSSYGESLDLEENGIFARRYNAAGTAQGNEFKVNTTTTGDESAPSVGVDLDGDFVIAWQFYAYGGDSYEYGMFARRYTNSGATAGGEFRIDTATTRTHFDIDLARNEAGKFVASWVMNDLSGGGAGIFARRFTSNGVAE